MILAILIMTLSNGNTNTTVFEPLIISKDTYDKNSIYYFNNFNQTVEEDNILKAYGEAAGDRGKMVTEANFTKFILDQGNLTF